MNKYINKSDRVEVFGIVDLLEGLRYIAHVEWWVKSFRSSVYMCRLLVQHFDFKIN